MKICKTISKKRKILITAFVTVIICLSVVSPVSVAFATPAVSYGGSKSFDIAVRGEKCPLEVEKKKIFFDIVDFPENKSDASNENYKSAVSLEYNFYNPTSEEVTAKFAAPLPDSPYYMGDEDYEKLCDSAKVTVNGEAVETAFRYTYYLSYNFTYEDVNKILDDYRSDGFYKKDLQMTKYTFRFSGIDEGKYHWATAEIDLKDVDSNVTKYCVDYKSWGRTYYDGGCKISVWARNNEDAIVYVLGENKPITADNVIVYTDEKKETKLDCNVTLENVENKTLSDEIFEEYDEKEKISKIDYFNIATDRMKYLESYDGRVTYFNPKYFVADSKCWLEYKLTIPAGGRAVNTVTSSVYPDIMDDYEPTVYRYRCSLTSPETWAKFGTFEAEIKTPYYVLYDSDMWTKTADGYKSGSEVFSYDNKLDFSLCTTETPRYSRQYHSPAWVFIAMGLLLFVGIRLIGSAVALILIIVTTDKGKSNKKG